MKVKLIDKHSVVKENLNYLITEDEKIVMRLSGGDTKKIVDNIFPLLNGKYTKEEVAEKVNDTIPKQDALKVINNLIANKIAYNLMEEEDNKYVKLAKDILSMLTTDLEGAFEHFYKTTIGVIGDVKNIDSLVRELQGFKFKEVIIYNDENTLDKIVEKSDFIVAIDNGWMYSDVLATLNKLCLNEKKSWLYSKFTSNKQIMIGPIFTGKRVCYECLVDRLRNNHKENYCIDIRDIEKYQVIKAKDYENELFWNELKNRLLIEIAKYILNVPVDSLVNYIETIDILGIRKNKYPILPVPKCICTGDKHLLYKMWDEDDINYEKMLFS